VRLVSGLSERELINGDSLELMLTPQALPDGNPNPQNYALGWRLARTQQFLGGRQKYRVAHHGGVSSGSSAFVAFFPDQSFAVAVLANSRIGSGPLSDLAFEVAEPFMAKIED
jgi:CubicO group peptidase (beta-lactamase class C family)